MTRATHNEPRAARQGKEHGTPLQRAWFRLVSLGFRLLYDELAWAYDPVSWAVSLGRWRDWQRISLRFLPSEGRVLELASGPGHVLVALHQAGLSGVGLDTSAGMVRLARRRLIDHRMPLTLCRGTALRLPFACRSFEAAVVTFPSPFVYYVSTHQEVARVLKPSGRLVIVLQARFSGTGPVHRTLEWLYRTTGQRGPAPDLARALRQAGFRAARHSDQVRGTTVDLIVAQKPNSPSDG